MSGSFGRPFCTARQARSCACSTSPRAAASVDWRRQSPASAQAADDCIHTAIRKLSTKPMPMLPSALPLEHGLRTIRSASFASVLHPRDGRHRRPGGACAAERPGETLARRPDHGPAEDQRPGARRDVPPPRRRQRTSGPGGRGSHPGRSPRPRARGCARLGAAEPHEEDQGARGHRRLDVAHLRFDRRLDAAAVARAAAADKNVRAIEPAQYVPARSNRHRSGTFPSPICHEYSGAGPV